MSDNISDANTEMKPIKDLSGFVLGVDENNHLDIEVAVNEKGKVVLFHNRAFKGPISWFEFDLDTNKLTFVLDDGEIRDAAFYATPTMAKYMQNSHQILMVLIDHETGEASDGTYVPLIIHRN
ncbi:MAG: hypothetical protein GW778_04865 [Alphaproteobacteria bacterium]|nr:hypothetical protein [Alphaproteobacteria bacterium]